MPKEIVSKEQVLVDPVIALIKAFRLANKRAGEYIRLGDNINYARMCERLNALANQAADEYNVNIWVNPNGNTGHTYEKDYRETRDSDNDYAEHLIRINRINEQKSRTSGVPDSDADADQDLEDDEDSQED